MASEKRSGWFYLFVSCGVLVLLAVVAVGAGTFVAVRWTQDLKKEIGDLELRTARGRDVMRAQRLPDGYQVMIHMDAPFGFGKMVVLSDGEATEKVEDMENAGEHLVIYLEGPGWDSGWREFLAGGAPPFDRLDEMNIEIGRSEEIASGSLTVGTMEVFYQANRGELEMNGFREDDGVFTVMMIRCENGGKRSRTLVWVGPVAAAGQPDSVTGSTGDPQRMSEFLGHFDLCG